MVCQLSGHFESAQAKNLIVSNWQRVNYQSFCRMKIVRLDKVLSELRLYEARAATSPLLPGFSSKSNSPRSASSPAGGRQASPSHLTATTGAGSRTDGMGRSNGILSPRADTPHAVEVDPSQRYLDYIDRLRINKMFVPSCLLQTKQLSELNWATSHQLRKV